MAIEREVLIQLKVQRPKDGAAFADAARQAKDLGKAVSAAGTSGAMADVAAGAGRVQSEAKAATGAVSELAKELGKVKATGGGSTKQFEGMSAAAKMLQADANKSREAVTAIARELGKSSKEAAGIDRVTAQLKAMGVGADAARASATKLMQSVGAGAKVAERDVQRLATAIKATGGGQAGGGILGRLRGLLNQPISQTSVGMAGATALGWRAGGNISNAFTQSLSTTADPQIQEMLSNRRLGGSAGANAIGNVHTGIPIFSQLRDLLSHSGETGDDIHRRTGQRSAVADFTDYMGITGRGSRQGAEDSNRRFERQQAALAQRRADNILRADADVARRAAVTGGMNQMNLAESERQGGFTTARERIASLQSDRRFDRVGQMQTQEFEAQARGEGLGRGSLAALQREIQTPQAFGGAAREQLDAERANAQRDIAASEANRQAATTAGTGGNEVQRAAAAEQLRTARERLVEIERRDVDLTRQASEAEQQRLERFRQFAAAAEESYRRIAQAERDRISTFREQFGLMNEIERANVAMIASRAAAHGGQGIQRLSGDELRQLQGTGLYQEQIRTEAGRRGDISGAQRIIQQSGAEGRVQQAEQRRQEAANIAVALNNQITNNITVTADATGRQIADQIMPAIQRVLAATVAQINERLDDQRNQLNQNAQAARPTP